MIIAVTGHRPPKLGNEWDGIGPISDTLRETFNTILDTYKPERILSGMALGVDMLWAETGIEKSIPVTACIPCKGQSTVWRPDSRERYETILAHPCVTRNLLNPLPYHPGLMHSRNIWMIDHSDMLVAVWDGSRGGTSHCVTYAKSKDTPIVQVDIKKIIREHGQGKK